MKEEMETLRQALADEGITVEREDEKCIHLAHGTSVELIGTGRFQVLSDGDPVAPFSSAEETAGFIKMDWAQRGLKR